MRVYPARLNNALATTMDSKNIYIGCIAMMQKAEWEKVKEDNEWRFVGEGQDFISAEVQKRINEFFSGDRIFFVLDRHQSKEIAKATAAEEVRNSLQNNTITLCEKDFRKFMMFHYIGVVRQGVFSS